MNVCFSGARLSAVSLACLSAFSAAVAAQGDASGVMLPESVVTATRTSRTADELMQSVDVLNREDIAHSGAATLMDVLAMLPGISVARTGGMGKTTSVFMRGGNSKHVLVLVNGVRAGSATLGEFDWNAYQLNQVERIEVVRGPLASLYGSDAISGVIQIFTRAEQPGAEVAQMFGSNNTRQTSARIDGGGDDLRWNLSAGGLTTDGLQMKKVDPKHYGFRSENVGLGVSGKLVDDWRYAFGVTRSEGRDQGDVASGRSEFTNQVVDLSLSGTVAKGWKQKLAFYLADNSLFTPDGYPPSDISTQRKQLTWLNELDVGVGALTLGVDRMLEGVRNVDTGLSSTVFDQKLGTTGLFAQFFTQWDKNDLQVSARRDKHSVFGSANTYSLAAGRELMDGVRVYASHGTAFKAPTANDLYWPYSSYTDTSGDCVTYGYACTFITQGNTSVRPERSRSNELGIQISGAVSYKFNVFDTHVKDLIDWDYTESGSGATWTETWFPQNIGQASMRGFEASVDTRLNNWSVKLAASRVLARNDVTGKPLDRRPENTATVQLARSFSDHRFSANLILSSERYEQAGTREIPGYARLDVADTVQLTPAWSLGLKVENLFDKQYALSTSSGKPYATPGRSFYATVRYAMK